MMFLMVVLNLVISWFNAWSVGRSWAETKAVGGVARFMAWCGAIMAACGFTWSYTAIIVGVCGVFDLLPAEYLQGVFSLSYLVIIIPVIGSGVAITIQSWASFWQKKTFGNGAVAGWNTFAQVYNTYQAFEGIPAALKGVGKMFDSDDESPSGRLVVVAVFLVALAIVGGIFTTRAIILTAARSAGYDAERKFES